MPYSFRDVPRRVLCLLLLAAGLINEAFCANAGVGTITGRILNPATGEYVRYAEVSVRGTSLVAISDENGVYRLTDVPSGDAVVTANFTGYASVVTTVRVSAGQETARDLELISTLETPQAAGTRGDVVKLSAFKVSTDR